MNVIRRHVLQLFGISVATIASPKLASALDAETGGAFKIAMGPVSAPQKPGGPAPNGGVTSGRPIESPRPKWRGHKHRR
jgi:hypothetical protein